jgi:U3 small nucleolar RNA-associated protein 13
LSPDDKHLITAHRNLLIKQWDNWREWPNEPFSHSQKTSKCTRTWKAIHTAPIQFMCFDPTSTLLATASSDYTTKIWDTEAQYCTHNLKGALGIVKCVRFHPLIEKVQQCITGSEDGKLRVYDLNRSEMIVSLEGHFSSITCFEYINYDDDSSLNYNYLISSSRDKVMIVWSLLNYSKLYTIPIYEAVESFLVIENTLTARSANFVESVTVKNLAVTGSINTDNHSWNALAADISAKTLAQLDRDLKISLLFTYLQS